MQTLYIFQYIIFNYLFSFPRFNKCIIKEKKIFIHSNIFPAIHLKFPEIIIPISIKNSIFSNHTSVTTNYRTKLIRAFCFCDSITQYIVASCCRVPNFKVHCVFIVGCINGHEFYFINLWESNSNPTIFTITYI